jgi:hypothetical protein
MRFCALGRRTMIVWKEGSPWTKELKVERNLSYIANGFDSMGTEYNTKTFTWWLEL